MSRKPWPKGKKLPRFATYKKEIAFWDRWYIQWDDKAHSEVVVKTMQITPAEIDYWAETGELPERIETWIMLSSLKT